MKLLFDDSDQHVGSHGAPDLRLDCILAGPQKALDTQMLLDPLEEQLHHSKPVKAWAAERQDKIELFYLPSYSPELNPEERLNADLKHAIGTKVPVRTKRN